jgi:hypothetical protein
VLKIPHDNNSNDDTDPEDILYFIEEQHIYVITKSMIEKLAILV